MNKNIAAEKQQLSTLRSKFWCYVLFEHDDVLYIKFNKLHCGVFTNNNKRLPDPLKRAAFQICKIRGGSPYLLGYFVFNVEKCYLDIFDFLNCTSPTIWECTNQLQCEEIVFDDDISCGERFLLKKI